MAEITAALVRELRDETGLPMMDCKQALDGSGRRQGSRQGRAPQEGHRSCMEGRGGRETAFGRFGIYTRRRQEGAARSSS